MVTDQKVVFVKSFKLSSFLITGVAHRTAVSTAQPPPQTDSMEIVPAIGPDDESRVALVL